MSVAAGYCNECSLKWQNCPYPLSVMTKVMIDWWTNQINPVGLLLLLFIELIIKSGLGGWACMSHCKILACATCCCMLSIILKSVAKLRYELQQMWPAAWGRLYYRWEQEGMQNLLLPLIGTLCHFVVFPYMKCFCASSPQTENWFIQLQTVCSWSLHFFSCPRILEIVWNKGHLKHLGSSAYLLAYCTKNSNNDKVLQYDDNWRFWVRGGGKGQSFTVTLVIGFFH